jgi:general secretion pathway protein L
MAQRILGLDLGASEVKAVFVESTFRGFAVVGAARAPVRAGEAPLTARQGAATRELLASAGLGFDSAVVAFPGPGVSSVVVTLPFTDPRRIEQTVAFEVEGQIPFDLADVAWDWQPLGTREGKTDLLVAVTRREELSAVVAALAEAGVDPRAILPAAPAYAALFASGAVAVAAPAAAPGEVEGEPGGPAMEPGAEVLVDVGAERTSIAIVAGGACQAARTFAFGSAHLARALARELGIPEVGAASIVASEGGGAELPTPLAGAAADALRRAVVPLVRELRATLRGWRVRVGQHRAERLHLAGGAARLPVLAEVLAPEVDGPVAPLALAGPAAEKLDAAAAPGMALALALALRGLGARAPRLNLRRGDLAFTRDFEHVKGKLTRLAAYAALVVLLAAASAGVKVFALSRQEGALDRALCDAQQKIIGKCYPDFEQAESILRGRANPGASLPRVSAVDLFAELSEKSPPSVPLRYERIEITKDKLHLQGTTEAAENVDKIVSALKGSRCFADARSGGARRRASDSKFEFSIDASLTCLDTGREPPAGRG